MLNFQDNFFFAKFTVLFFILTIFGYWGIDLNSEELYIAFSFFLLVILGVVLSRRAVLTLFVKSVNQKYFRILSDLLVVVSALTLRLVELKALVSSLVSLRKLVSKLITFTSGHFSGDASLVRNLLSARTAFLSSFLSLSLNVFFKNVLRLKKFYSFSAAAAKFFSIKF